MNSKNYDVSLVVPVLNGEESIARLLESIRAVKKMSPYSYEVWVIDGNSSDGTIDVVKRFSDVVKGYVSEPDNGQSDAINKGADLCSGVYFNWLCADDEVIAENYVRFVDKVINSNADFGVASSKRIYCDGSCDRMVPVNGFWEEIPFRNPIDQPSVLMRLRDFIKVGKVEESFNFAMDFHLWGKIKALDPSTVVDDQDIVIFHFDEDNKTSVGGRKLMLEMDRVLRLNGEHVSSMFFRLFYFMELLGLSTVVHALVSCRYSPRQFKLYNWSFCAKQEKGVDWWK